MRTGVIALALVACSCSSSSSDRAASLPAHRVAPDLAAALADVIGDEVRVVGLGELHARVDRPSAARTALARFADALPAIAARTSDLVVETWLFDRRCGEEAARGTAVVEATMQRPASTKDELATLVERARAAGVQPHAMRVTCEDWAAVAPPGGEVDHEAMLDLVTRELGRIAAQAVEHRDREGSPRRLVALYGGALHNDLYPNEGVAEWSYAPALDRALGGRYLEVDLYVPEYAEHDPISQAQPWFPLVAAARRDGGVLVVERGPRSYVLILPRS